MTIISLSDSLLTVNFAYSIYGQEDPLPHFKRYLRLAAKHKALPEWWDASVDVGAIVKTAVSDEWADIRYCVEKSDIQEHYDATMPMFLRMLAEEIYKKSVYDGTGY